MRRLLEPVIGEITIVADGQQALDAHAAASAEGLAYDILVLDMQMPIVSGYDAARVLRDQGNRTPILALTAQAMHGDRERCLAVGCDDYLSKPIDRDQLLKKLARLAAIGYARRVIRQRQSDADGVLTLNDYAGQSKDRNAISQSLIP